MSHVMAGTLTMTGTDISTRVMVTAVGSCHLPCLWAMKKPRGSPPARLMSIAANASWPETHIFLRISSRTGCPLCRLWLLPKSPRTKWET